MNHHRWLEYRTVAVFLVCGLFLSPAMAQQNDLATSNLKFEQLPGYSNYQQIKKSRRKLAGGGSIFRIRWAADGQSVGVRHDGEDLQFNFVDGSIVPYQDQPIYEKPETASKRRRGAVARAEQRTSEFSPDGKWVAQYKNFNLHLSAAEGNRSPRHQGQQITDTGTDRFRYGTGCWVYGEELDQDQAMWWSPDSSRLVFYEIDEREMQDYYLTTDNTAAYTSVDAVRYPKAGYANPKVGLWVYELATGKKTRLKIPGPTDQYLFNLRFVPDTQSQRLLIYRTDRRQAKLDVLLFDLETNQLHTVVSQQQATWQENLPTLRFLADGQRFVWEAEDEGWKRFELRDLNGSLINRLSDNRDYPVKDIVSIDEAAGWFYYSAYSDSNPYSLQLHRCRLDGSESTRLTNSPLNHSNFQIAPDHQHVIAKRQQLDTPVSTVIYDTAGQQAGLLAEGSTRPALEAHLSPPETFTFLANDGTTKIYGTLHKPANFSADKKYPLLIDVYGGPQSTGISNNYRPANPICELGFLVAKIGNRGTVGRGKAFESATYLQLGIPDLDDQASAVKHLSQRPYIDSNRVGIYGHSYGGYLSALAMLRYPDVFHVAVAGSPVTDWRNYDSIYTERYLRLPEENLEGYRNGSCVELADRLTGKLLLVHGLIDNNVHPSNTWQLVQALQDADKRFDLMIYPEFQHGIGSTYEALRWEYLCRHLHPVPETAGQ